MKGTKAASRYAKGLLELAIENNKVEQIAADMKYLGEVSEESKEFVLMLNSPIVKSDKKVAVMNEIFGQFEDITMRFVQLVAKNGREGLLPAIASSFDQQVKDYKGIVPVTIISAVPLAADTKKAILDRISVSVKGTLEVTEKIDNDLIGGFVVRMGDTQIDASIARQFSNLKQRLTR